MYTSSKYLVIATVYRCASGSSVTFCVSLTSAASPLGPSGYESSCSGVASRSARCFSCAYNIVSTHLPMVHPNTERPKHIYFQRRLTNGSPQYVHQQIWGLSTLMKILGCPRGPPPPSQDTVRSCVQRTGCLWMSSMAAYGRG